jgi:acetyl-CoA synthetase
MGQAMTGPPSDRGLGEWPSIHKAGANWRVSPNMNDYEVARAAFSWHAARGLLDGLPEGRGLNIAHEAVDRHARGPLAGKTALRFIDCHFQTRDISYQELASLSNCFANVLRSLGVGQGDRVFVLAGRVPVLYVAVLGTLKNKSVICPLFAGFGPDPIVQRLTLGNARVLVTTEGLFRHKVAPVADSLVGLAHVIVVGADFGEDRGLHVVDFDEAMANAKPTFEIGATDPEDMALLHFTSGTTGPPRAAVHVHEAVLSHYVTGGMALDLHSEDVFWCTADPGWVTGTSYGIIAPLSHGVTSIIDEGDFDVERWYRILESERVTVWYTAPTAVRMLMRAGDELPARFDLRALRFVASVGEPLNPEAVVWGSRVFGQPIHDNWWQTETGAIMIANYACMDIRPGSMGKPLPGVDAAVLARDPTGKVVVRDGHVMQITSPVVEGELALRRGWPSMFRSYLHDEDQYNRCFLDDWYLTGDVVRRDADGYFWFVGRGDDVIKSAGHLIGPFEVESVLIEHPAVVEAGVIGKPDPVAGEVVKAFVSLHSGYEPTDDLRLELLGWSRKRLGASVAPREIAFDQHLPYTTSGKVMRRLLKAREVGAHEGDLSTLGGCP